MVDNLVDEGILQQQACLTTGDTSLLHIEQSSIVQLTDSRTVGTLHIVGINLQHRLGEHARRLRGTKVLVGHLRHGLLCIGLHQHPAGKGACGVVVEDILVKLVAGAVRNMMGDERVVIDMLLLVGNDTATAGTLSTLADEIEVQFVARGTVV